MKLTLFVRARIRLRDTNNSSVVYIIIMLESWPRELCAFLTLVNIIKKDAK